ncbi:hypothetical protein BDK51DRAFT_43956 [Blyttiomyces helicus]|uniref:Uncharacterized protein n=1 Tax=Blyttiomyces helicus TaxID=388810 RepID=A0A4P9WFF3_9FUNG|nr:hypothetical protein BDK51DRAFT_43956 [Blyttiomyces helicus]|eukprot:RKO91479.1 hypothetical protein BDK51DRAFT_43956 [Blyttiomyces helicus]
MPFARFERAAVIWKTRMGRRGEGRGWRRPSVKNQQIAQHNLLGSPPIAIGQDKREVFCELHAFGPGRVRTNVAVREGRGGTTESRSLLGGLQAARFATPSPTAKARKIPDGATAAGGNYESLKAAHSAETALERGVARDRKQRPVLAKESQSHYMRRARAPLANTPPRTDDRRLIRYKWVSIASAVDFSNVRPSSSLPERSSGKYQIMISGAFFEGAGAMATWADASMHLSIRRAEPADARGINALIKSEAAGKEEQMEKMLKRRFGDPCNVAELM